MTNIYTYWKQATVIEQGYLCVHVSVRVYACVIL